MSDITVPNFGESITSATISQWLVADGEHVTQGTPLVTLETDKVSSDLEATEDGILHIGAKEGEDVAVGSVIGSLNSTASVRKETLTKPAATDDARRSSVSDFAARIEENRESAPAPIASTRKAAALPAAKSARYTRTPMTRLRRTIAEKLVQTQHEAALLTTFNECDMSAVIGLRKQFKEEFPSGKNGTSLGFMSFFIKAAVQALKDIPQINARIDGNDIIANRYYDISIAIGTDRGLVVPVIRDCDQKNHLDIEAELSSLAQKAKENTLSLQDLQGGVFTISNGGVYGSMLSTPIPNPPQSAVLGMHAIQERPVARNGQIVIRPMMYLALSYDHRLIDGKEAVSFLLKIREMIENPILEC